MQRTFSPPPCPSPSPEISLLPLSLSSLLSFWDSRCRAATASLLSTSVTCSLWLPTAHLDRRQAGVGEARPMPCTPWCSRLPWKEIYESHTGLSLVSVVAASPSIFAFSCLSLFQSYWFLPAVPHPWSLYMHSHRLYPTNLFVSSRFCHPRLCFMYSFLFKCSSKSLPRLWAD